MKFSFCFRKSLNRPAEIVFEMSVKTVEFKPFSDQKPGTYVKVTPLLTSFLVLSYPAIN